MSGLMLWLSVGIAHGQLGRYCAEFRADVSDFADTITIEWERDRIYVPVESGGRRLRFLLDTGAGQSVVFQGTELAAGPRKGGLISHDATGHTDTLALVALPPLRLGRVTLSGGQALVQRHSLLSRGIDGILGFDVVNSGLSMKIDVPSRQLILTDRSHLFCREPNTERLHYKLSYHVPYVQIIPYGRKREQVRVDTGSRQFFAMNKESFDNRPLSLDMSLEGLSVGRHATGHHGVESESEVAFLQLNNLRVGGYSFSDIHTLTTLGSSHLGARLLRYGAVAFCPRHRSMMFQPVSLAQPCQVGNRQLEIAFVADAHQRPQVGMVWEQGEPYRLGFRQGDIIEQIDHKEVRTLGEFLRWPFIRGRQYLFTLRDRQGRRHEVRWVRVPADSGN